MSDEKFDFGVKLLHHSPDESTKRNQQCKISRKLSIFTQIIDLEVGRIHTSNNTPKIEYRSSQSKIKIHFYVCDGTLEKSENSFCEYTKDESVYE